MFGNEWFGTAGPSGINSSLFVYLHHTFYIKDILKYNRYMLPLLIFEVEVKIHIT